MSVTLKQIAQQVGVSQPLVSYALNGNPRVSEETRRRIIEVANELGYNPQNNRSARAMAARRHGTRVRSQMLALLLPQPTGRLLTVQNNPYFLPFFCGVEMEATMRGYDLLVCAIRNGELPRLVSEGEVDGVVGIVVHNAYQQLEQLKLPALALGTEQEGTASLVAADADGIHQAVTHLVELGHRRIAYLGLGFVEDFITGRKRLEAYRAALRGHGVPVDEALIETTPGNLDATVTAEHLDKLLERGGDFTALVCYNDLMAMAAVNRLQELGRKVPSDVAVVGFDDFASEIGFHPALTSVAYDRMEMGRLAVQTLCEHLDNGGDAPLPSRVTNAPVQLVRRATT